MEEIKKVKEERLKTVSGGEWNGHHICGECGAEMLFDRPQPENNSAVYRCPNCRNEEAFPY